MSFITVVEKVTLKRNYRLWKKENLESVDQNKEEKGKALVHE